MGARILVADDSATIQKVVELTLARENVELVQARSGDEAMQKAREVKPDLMLIDHSTERCPDYPDGRGLWECGRGGGAPGWGHRRRQ